MRWRPTTILAGAVLLVASSCNCGASRVGVSFTVGGTVTGLVGSGLVLQDLGASGLPINRDGAFTLPGQLSDGSTYLVTVLTQPSSPTQSCTVSSPRGTISGADVTSVAVTCAFETYVVGGTVTGLAGAGLVLQDNGADDLSISANGVFSFETPLASGSAFSVSVENQPSMPSQLCTVTGGAGTVTGNISVRVTCVDNTFTIGGTVTGLAGAGLILEDNGSDELTVASGPSFTFPEPIDVGGTFNVTVAAQPTGPSQTCSVSGGTGVVAGENVASVAVTCATDTFTIGGSVTGLVGSGLALQDSAGDQLPVSTNGTFTFATPVASGGAFSVFVVTQPTAPEQTCLITDGFGTVTASDVTSVAVSCSTNQYPVGGAIIGLAGSGLVLQDKGSDDLTVLASADSFVFPTLLSSGTTYAVTVASQPTDPSQTCVVSYGATGTIVNGAINDVDVVCSTSVTAGFTIGVDVTGLATSSTLVLGESDGDSLTVTGNGEQSFPTPLPGGATYSISVVTQPVGTTCTLTSPGGVITADVLVSVTCTPNDYPVEGTVTGLLGGGLVLANGATTLAIAGNGPFTFPSQPNGSSYAVSVRVQPTQPWQTCEVLDGIGKVQASPVTGIAVVCVTNLYSVSVDVSGLVPGTGTNAGLIVSNSGDSLPISGNGETSFPTKVPSGGSYDVTVTTQPGSPAQLCTVDGGSGAVAGATVTVQVACVIRAFSIGGTVTGLAPNDSVELSTGNDVITLTADGSFTFDQAVQSGASYAVTVTRAPTTPYQTCSVTNGKGEVEDTNVTNIEVECATAVLLDAGPIDAGPIDAGPIDAGTIDAGPIDAGPIDAGPIDAGPIDAGPIDAGPIDAGPVDAGPIDAGPIDAGPIDAGPVDAGPIDAGPMGAAGCSDGTREGFTSLSEFPTIAGCSGGWSIPGVMAEDPGMAPACPSLATYDTVDPACGRVAGNSSSNPTGTGCNVADLCAAGWHVCATAQDVQASSPNRCNGAATDTDLFFVTRQSSDGCNDCAIGTSTDASCNASACEVGCLQTEYLSNDVYGCGTMGYSLDTCGALDKASGDLCGDLTGSWSCDEGAADSSGECEAYTVVHGDSSGGGVLCCADATATTN